MDPIKIEKLEAMNKYKKNQFLSSLVLYSLAAFSCSLFCSSPLWFPPLFSSTKSFLFLSIPKLRSFLFNPKCLFVVCNIIIIFLVGESRLMGSSSSSATDIYDEYMKKSQSLGRFSSQEEKRKTGKLEMHLIEETTKRVHEGRGGEEKGEKSFDGEEEPGLPSDEFKKRVEDFIERVNRQRRLEAKQLI
ncbi:hypothetical protein NE237_021890 [Protea cynaroides]|uniref:DUF4408 domain-containing protein n=1 Tax=Protea cynaroides TaxID=273540 RepID=A0A9Q0H9Z4_9MAGN|nr:hypothetical protein NE237_021890 [Protea cynaroides]